MKVFVSFIALLLIKYSYGTVDVNLSVAFENVTRHLFELETRMFIDNYGVDLNELTLLILKGLNERAMPFQLNNKKLDNEVQMDSSTLITFESFGKLQKFNDKLALTNKYSKPLQLFLFCRDASVKMIESLAADVLRRHKNSQRKYRMDFAGVKMVHNDYIADENTALTDVINYEYFLIEESEFLKLLTFVWYSPNKCGKLQLIEVNKFNMKTSIWENEKFLIEKLANFHGCEIVYLWVVHDTGWHFQHTVPDEIAANLNFKLKLYLKKPGSKVDFYQHRACYDSHNYMDVFDNIFDPTTGKGNKTNVDCFIAWPIEYSPTWLAVPPGENHSEYEKLAMPFDEFTWILIAFTFVAAFVTILVLYCMPRSIRNFVIGSNVTTPSLNILQIFFGIGMIELPRRNFARFLTMSFILYCLIIRTAWQGKMFEFMTKDVPKPEVQTIDEAIEKGYNFYMDYDFKTQHPDSEITKRGKFAENEYGAVTVTDMNFDKTFEDLLQPNFKGVVQVDYFQAQDIIKRTLGHFIKRLRSELVISTQMCGLAFMSHHHFTGIFDLKSQQLFNAGISRFSKGRDLHYQAVFMHYKVKYKIPPDEPQNLNLEKLEPGFVIFSSCLLFTIFVFLIELLSKLCRYLLPTFKSKRQFRVANLALNAAKVAIAVVPEIDSIEIENQVVINWADEPERSFEENNVVKHEDDEMSIDEAEKTIATQDVEANDFSMHTIIRRDSIDELIDAFESKAETVEQTRLEAKNQTNNRKDSIADLLEAFEIQADSVEQSEVIHIDDANDHLVEDDLNSN